MNKVILCEGATDAILLSYYMSKCYGWEYCKKPPKDVAIHVERGNETANWYSKGDDRLLICAVGGKDNFSQFFEEKIKAPIKKSDAFESLVVITDRDNREVKEITEQVRHAFSGVISSFQCGSWCENTFQDAFGLQKTIRSLLIVIPNEHEGALETVMLDAIREDEYNANVVQKSIAFVREMREVADKYISTNRLELKASLGVTWAIQYPEKIFSLIDEQIRSVAWEESKVLHQCFCELKKL